MRWRLERIAQDAESPSAMPSTHWMRPWTRKTDMISRRRKPIAFKSPIAEVFCTVRTRSVFITQKTATSEMSERRSAVMFFSTASALKISRSASRQVTWRRLGAISAIAAETAPKRRGSVGQSVLTWMAKTPLSRPIRSRTLGSDATT